MEKSNMRSIYRLDFPNILSLKFVRGEIESSLSWQLPAGDEGSGLFATQASLGDDLFLAPRRRISCVDQRSRILKAILATSSSTRETYLDPSSGLLGDSYDHYYFTAGPVPNATAPAAPFAYALRKLVRLADAVWDTASATAYSSTVQSISDATNDFLWNPKTGTYGVALLHVNDYSLTSMSFAILAGIMNDTQIESTPATALPKLFYMTRYKESSSTTASLTTQLSQIRKDSSRSSTYISKTITAVQPLQSHLPRFPTLLTSTSPKC
ncbi:hypothetical protein ZTR_08222 [Talaromyces verruculosus]|nr:hypothetical protein ZTR_08222 [Talaromyces verruculosus]